MTAGETHTWSTNSHLPYYAEVDGFLMSLPDGFALSPDIMGPYPAHAAIREARQVVFLQRYGIYTVLRHSTVRAVLTNWQAFASGSGFSLTGFTQKPPWCLPSQIL